MEETRFSSESPLEGSLEKTSCHEKMIEIPNRSSECVEPEEDAFVTTHMIEPDTRSSYSGSSESEVKVEVKRDQWARDLDFVLSLLGYVVGLGNLWRFPYLCVRNGGGAFLIPFVTCLITVGVPLVFLEISLGQFLGKSSLHAWCICPLFKGMGLGMLIAISTFALYYNMIMAWTLYYLGNSFTETLPWSRCDGDWNTGNCSVRGQYFNISSLAGNVTNQTTITMKINAKHTLSSEEEFWQYNVLEMSSGLEDIGSMPWHLPLCLFLAWTVVYLCIIKGVRSIGKVVYVTATLPYLLLAIFLIKGLTLEGSLDGIVYYLKPDIHKMMNIRVWLEALLQVFYSLGPGWGPLITMASYNNFNANCLRDSLIVSFASEGTSVFSGLVVFTILGYIANELNLPIDDIVKSGPGLGFIAYPQALARLPVPQLWAVLFFIMLFMVGLDSQFAATESVIAGLLDLFPRLQRRRELITLLICLAGFVLGLPMCFQGGMYIFQLIDWYAAILVSSVFSLLECIIIAWIYGTERYSRDIELMLGRGVPLYMMWCWSFVTPILLMSSYPFNKRKRLDSANLREVADINLNSDKLGRYSSYKCCLVFLLWTYKPASYGSYQYPVLGEVIGWIIASLPLIPLPVFAVREYFLNKHKSFRQLIQDLLQPSEDWKPQLRSLQTEYSVQSEQQKHISYSQKLKMNLTGQKSH